MYVYKVSPKVQSLIEECIDLLHSLSVPIATNIVFVECGGRSCYGWCKNPKNIFASNRDNFTIAINKYLCDEREIKSTIIHELLHTIDIGNGKPHGKEWKYWANYVTKNTDYVIFCTAKYEVKNAPLRRKRKPFYSIFDYDSAKMDVIFCPTCGDKICVDKGLSRGLAHESNIRCGKCKQYYYYRLPQSLMQNATDEQKQQHINNFCSGVIEVPPREIECALPYLSYNQKCDLYFALFLRKPQWFIDVKILYTGIIRAFNGLKLESALQKIAQYNIDNPDFFLAKLEESKFLTFLSAMFSLTEWYPILDEHYYKLKRSKNYKNPIE